MTRPIWYRRTRGPHGATSFLRCHPRYDLKTDSLAFPQKRIKAGSVKHPGDHTLLEGVLLVAPVYARRHIHKVDLVPLMRVDLPAQTFYRGFTGHIDCFPVLSIPHYIDCYFKHTSTQCAKLKYRNVPQFLQCCATLFSSSATREQSLEILIIVLRTTSAEFFDDFDRRKSMKAMKPF